MTPIIIPSFYQSPEKNEYKELTNAIKRYYENPNKLITLKVDGFMRFALPKRKLKYGTYYSWADQFQGKLTNLLTNLKRFNYQSKGSHSLRIPDFIGSMDQSFIQFKGECFQSNNIAFFLPIFSWLELFLATKPQSIRLEFWMSYFNTSASRKFLEFIKLLEKYYEESKANINIYWYYSDDEYMLEEGEDFQADTSLNFEIIRLDPYQWKQMTKEIF